ncbi:DUF2855 family protein [Novosphingobium sp. Gsoil 351]|uniref:DUF2855 family protein n=1 Tax=Novosphingobium sp. Gsoil 351 TaxID=2675225 RepID=UPI0012B46E41|nr:DUF2855 family protein [Novosphingobium sp. Gsoil 351]QGN56075.1 DUF2855 family protein [Novosphingobium sp. Gsoil 351]
MSRTVQVRRAALNQMRIVEAPLPPLGQDEARLRVESFSVTANNVTYAVAGDAFGYWNFFPGEGKWGVVPMWGHAVVEASNHPGITVGERVYGYLPMATHLDVLPVKVGSGGFVDGAAHRQPMSPIYNQYSRLAADPEHDPAREAERMIFGPLFKTGFLIESMFRGKGWFGAEAVISTSASSKTAMALASVARDKSPQVERIGLTSPGRVDFVKATGFYDRVLAYDAVASLPQAPSVSVDFAGNAALLHAIHSALGDNLRYSCTVGATHVGQGFGRENGALPGPAPVLFFAPDHAVAAIAELGPKGFGDAVAASWAKFVRETEGAVRVDERHGLAAAQAAFVDTLNGVADPAVGIVILP